MKKFNCLILASCLLIGCHDFAFDYFGKSSQKTNGNAAPNVYISATGEVVRCTNDDQCGQELSCLKDSDNYIGVCGQLIVK